MSETEKAAHSSAHFSPILNQPRTFLENEFSATGWMQRPRESFNLPPGLEYLADLNQILIHQKFELLQYGFEPATEFVVKNSAHQLIYFAKEESEFWKRELFRAIRPMKFKIMDKEKRDVLIIKRPLRGPGYCCLQWGCCSQWIEVMAGGRQIGFVKQERGRKNVKYLIQNSCGDTLLQLIGPVNKYADEFAEFTITSRDGSNAIGKILKKWLGPSGNASMRSDAIIISFPMEIDVNTKALLLASGFLITFMYYENRQIYLEYTYRY